MGASQIKKTKTWMKVLDGVFDFKDKVNSSLGRETSAEWNKRMIKEYSDHLRGLNVPDLQKILNEIQEDWKSGLYHKVIIAFEERQMNCRSLTFEELSHNKLTTLAVTNLPSTSLKTISSGKTDLNIFHSMDPIIETLYYLNSRKPYNWNDLLNLAFSELKILIVFALDKFDQVEYVPEPTAKFFQKLKETRIIDEQTKDLEMKIKLVLMHIEGEIFGMDFGDSDDDYWPTMSLFIQLLAGCNAVHHNREHIIEEDIVKAYKTFFKLMKTDVTQYKAIPELVQDMDENNPNYSSVLICKSCGGYYKLELEFADDFVSCHCGGELKYLHYESTE